MNPQQLTVIKLGLILGILSFHIVAVAVEHSELKNFPPAKEGMERFVIVLPHKGRGEDESFKVEIIPGKLMQTDGVNRMRLASTIEPRDLVGWGYTYYEVTGSSDVMSTMMAPPEGASMVERFVAGTSLEVRYNSRLPIVIYAPKGFDIRYRIWQASETILQADKK